jgi:hypothetical protein
MSDNDLVQSTNRRVGVLFYHALCLRMVDKVSALLDEGRQVSELAEFHDDMHAGGRFLAVNERYYVRVVKAAQDGDFGDEVVLELLVQLVHVDRFDGNGLALLNVNATVDFGEAALANVVQALELANDLL